MHLLVKTVLFLLGLLFTFSLNAGEHSLSLNGIWSFSNTQFDKETDVLSENYQNWDRISVPGNWELLEKYKDYSGKAYYQRDFHLPAKWKEKTIRLKFDAVYETARVWVNGAFVGEHVGGYTPFEFIVNDVLMFGKSNSVLVEADNSYKRGAWWPWGGISRDVSIIADDQLRLVYQHISSLPDFDKKRIDYAIQYKIKNHSNKVQKITINSKVLDRNAVKKHIQTRVEMNPYEEKTKTIRFQEKINKYKLWHIDQPNLYHLHSSLELNGRTMGSVEDHFGIRKFEVKGESFYLNNQPIRLNGINRVHDHPQHGNTEPYALVLSDMKDIKSMGANFSRLMHAPLSKSLLKVCDQLGYLIVAEIPVWGDDDPQSYPDNPVTKRWLKEMIERDFNHPSIVGWSVGNELRDPIPPWEEKTLTEAQFSYVNSMLDYVSELDPTRLKTYVSLTAFSNKANMSNEPYEKVDFISINSYDNAVTKVEATHKNFPGKPIFLAEIGIKQIGGTREAGLSDELVRDLKALKAYSYLTGLLSMGLQRLS